MPHRILDLDDNETELASGLRGPAPYPKDDDQEEDKYAVYSRALLDEQRAGMEDQHLVWTQNLLFLQGLQWWRYDSVTGTFQPPKEPGWKERPVRNILVPYFKHAVAKLTKNRPATTAVPASSDPQDIQASELGDDVLEAKWTELNRARKLRRMLAWLVTTGNGFIMPFWNTDSGILHPLTTLVEALKVNARGEPVVDPETGQPMPEIVECPCDEEGEPKRAEDGSYDIDAEPAYVDIGEVGDKVLSPFQVYVDLGAEAEEDVTYYLIVEPLTLREIKRRWPDTSDDVVGEDTSEIDRFDHLVTGAVSGADTHLVPYRTQRSSEVPKALAIHYFERPSADYPGGRHWVSAGRQLLEPAGDLPDGVWPPVHHIKDIEMPGRFHGEATMTSAVGLQREYNEINAQIKEHHNLLLRGKWLVPIGSNIRRGQITSQPGEVIQHTPGLEPKMADLKPLPQKVYDEREQVLADFEAITSVHKISMGKPPPGVTSGRAFLTLQEADDTDFGPLLAALEEFVADWSWSTLQIIQRFYEEERLLRVAGENRRYRVRAFKGADLSAIVDVKPQQGSAFPWSQVAKQSMMIELAEAIPDLFIDPETGMFDQERFRRLLPVGGNEAVGTGADLDINEALREEEEFEYWDGMSPLPTIKPWQNHGIHERQHARLLKSGSFENWPPEAQQAFMQHYMETKDAIFQEQMKELQKEIAAQQHVASQLAPEGAPGGGGGGNGGRPGASPQGGGLPGSSEQAPPELSEHERAMKGE